MARRKRQRQSASTSASTQGSTRRKAPRPSQQWIEVPSDEEAEAAVTERKGAGRGLSTNNILSSRTATKAIEASNHDDQDVKASAEAKHETRGARNGRSKINYDMKYHPAFDNALRPAFAARKRSGSRSRSRPFKGNEDETEEESLPSSAINSDSGSERSDEGSDQEDVVPIERVPDPNATRHSTRTVAKKRVMYSSKHHPNDAQLPGYQYKARKLKQQARRAASAIPKSATYDKQRSSPSVVVDRSEDEAQSARPHKRVRFRPDDDQSSEGPNANEGEAIRLAKGDDDTLLTNAHTEPANQVMKDASADEEELGEPVRPRKKLRLLDDERPSPQKTKSRRTKKTTRKVTASHEKTHHPDASTNDVQDDLDDASRAQDAPLPEEEDFVAMACKKPVAMTSHAQVISSDQPTTDTTEDSASNSARVEAVPSPQRDMRGSKDAEPQPQTVFGANQENDRSELMNFADLVPSRPSFPNAVKGAAISGTVGKQHLLPSDPLHSSSSVFEELMANEETPNEPPADAQDLLTSGSMLDNLPVSQRERSDEDVDIHEQDQGLPPSNQSEFEQAIEDAHDPTTEYPSPAESFAKVSNPFTPVNAHGDDRQAITSSTQLPEEKAQLQDVDAAASTEQMSISTTHLRRKDTSDNLLHAVKNVASNSDRNLLSSDSVTDDGANAETI